MHKSLLACLLAIAVVGCRTGNSPSDVDAVQQEFSQENYEKAMIEAGKGEELEAEKKKWAESQGKPDEQQGQ